jgi:hypothetical protein
MYRAIRHLHTTYANDRVRRPQWKLFRARYAGAIVAVRGIGPIVWVGPPMYDDSYPSNIVRQPAPFPTVNRRRITR